jgi:cell division protein FtsI/penicillin-binding protein 2
VRKWAVLALAVVVLAAGAVVAILALRPGKPETPDGAVAAFLSDWTRGDYANMAVTVDAPPPDFAAIYQREVKDLTITKAEYHKGTVLTTGTRATATYHAVVTLKTLGDWTYDGSLDLRRAGGQWKVVWTPAAIHPALRAGTHFARKRTVPTRAAILGRDGSQLAGQGQIVTVGLQPSRIKDRPALLAALAQQIGADPAKVSAALDRPGLPPDQFLPVADVRADKFTQVQPVLEPIPGVFFQRKTGRVTVSDGFAPQTLGRTGEITAELLTKMGDRYQQGDQIGLTGLEQAYESQLAGVPGGEVDVVDDANQQVAVVFTFPGVAPRPLRTTLDATIQQAAQQALVGVTQPAALVAVDATSGGIRAVVSTPTDQFNRALAGRYPPGSTFKVVTATALLAHGVTRSTAVDCPDQINAGGRTFKNVEGEQTGSIPFELAFARSCNTAFIGQAKTLPDGALADAAKSFGFGIEPALGLSAAGARFPTPGDAVEKAAAAIGQAKVDASPLAMASVAAAALSGQWQSPHLIEGDGAPTPPAAVAPLDQATVANLKAMMGLVVTQGTAAKAGLPAGTIGKTGSAEFGTDNPPKTHAWFIGSRNGLAFAVLVEGGGFGGDVAAPIAAKFLNALG